MESGLDLNASCAVAQTDAVTLALVACAVIFWN